MYEYPDPEKTHSKIHYSTMITAHSGAEGTEDNTLESLHVMLSTGADAVEVDVMSHDSALYLSHDPMIPQKKYATLKDAFSILAAVPDILMNIDVKTAGLIDDIVLLARFAAVQNRIIITGDVGPGDYHAIKKNSIQLWMDEYLLPGSQRRHPLRGVEQHGFWIVNTDIKRTDDLLLKKQPERFSVWTVNDEEAPRKLLPSGVKNMTACAPCLALGRLEEIQQPCTN